MGPQAGAGSLFNFSAVFIGTLNVPQAGNVTLHVTAADGWMLGIGGGAVPVSGSLTGAATTKPFTSLLTVAANNQRATAPSTQTVVVYFPAAGTYPFELDYASGGGPKLSLVMTTDAGPVPPAISLPLTASIPGPLHAGQLATVSL
jgi:hypothetical protein